MKEIDEVVCANCWDLVEGPHKTKDAEYYGINHKIFCGLSCFNEDYDKNGLTVQKEVKDEGSKARKASKRKRSTKKTAKRKS